MRTVRQEISVDAAVDFASQKWARGRDAWDAMIWALARDPSRGVAVSPSGNTRTLTLHGAASIYLPTVTVLYVFDANTVTVFDVHFS